MQLVVFVPENEFMRIPQKNPSYEWIKLGKRSLRFTEGIWAKRFGEMSAVKKTSIRLQDMNLKHFPVPVRSCSERKQSWSLPDEKCPQPARTHRWWQSSSLSQQHTRQYNCHHTTCSYPHNATKYGLFMSHVCMAQFARHVGSGSARDGNTNQGSRSCSCQHCAKSESSNVSSRVVLRNATMDSRIWNDNFNIAHLPRLFNALKKMSTIYKLNAKSQDIFCQCQAFQHGSSSYLFQEANPNNCKLNQTSAVFLVILLFRLLTIICQWWHGPNGFELKKRQKPYQAIPVKDWKFVFVATKGRNESKNIWAATTWAWLGTDLDEAVCHFLY